MSGFPISEEQQMLVDTVRAFVENELYPHEDLVEEIDDVPAELAAEIQKKSIELGLYAANMPEQYGGGGLDNLSLTLLERELGRASYGLQMCIARPSNILQGCKGDQIERYLIPVIKGTRHDCLAMMAATGVEETSKGKKAKISAFLVDMGTPGFTMRRGPHCVSHKGYHQCELFFDDCVVHESQLLGEEHKGFELMGEWLGATRLTVAATSVGRARRVLDSALDWASQRKQFGEVIGKFQGVSFQLADMLTEIEASDLLTLAAADKLDKGTATDTDFAMAKLFASETLARVTDKAIQIYGGMGLMSSLKIERWWRDARVERIWDGTSEIQRHIISRAMLRPRGA